MLNVCFKLTEQVAKWKKTRGGAKESLGVGGSWESTQEVEGQEVGSHVWVQRVKEVGGGANKKERKKMLTLIRFSLSY